MIRWMLRRLGAPCALLTLALFGVLTVEAWGASAALPRSLKQRRAEIEAIQKEVDQWAAVVGPRINEAVALVPSFMAHHARVQDVPLTAEERRLLKEAGLDGLPAEKSRVFREAAAAMAPMRERLAAYFEAYDGYQLANIRLRTFGAVLAALEKYSRLKRYLSDWKEEKLDREVDKVKEKERAFRRALVNPQAKNHEIVNPARALTYEADALDDKLEKYCRKYGLSPAIPFGHRVGSFLRKLKLYCRVGRCYAATLPACAGMVAYAYNPFRKQPDPKKVSGLLRFFSKSYRWAAGLDLKVKGAQGLPEDGPVVFAFSHRSNIEDAVTMMAVVPHEYSFMVAQRALPAFLNDVCVNEPSVINVGGWMPDGSTVDAISAGIRALKEGRDLAVFPEGTTPTRQGETWPLRSGIDVVTESMGTETCYIVPVSIADPSVSWDQPLNASYLGGTDLAVTFGRAIDPLKFKAVPGADRQLLLDLVRFHWHKDLYRADVSFEAQAENLGTLTGGRDERFDELHQNLE